MNETRLREIEEEAAAHAAVLGPYGAEFVLDDPQGVISWARGMAENTEELAAEIRRLESANTTLIAAAEAGADKLAWVGRFSPYATNETVDMLREAISKAKGETDNG